jgi:Na+/proline symporter
MACRTDRDARVAASLFAFLQIGLRSLLWVVIALALLVLIPPQEGLAGVDLVRDRETSFVRGMTALLPPGVLGLMWTAMLAALMSTLDTHLNWGASYVANDLHGALLNRWRGRSPSPREQVWVARLANLALLGLALAITAWLDTIQEAWRATLVLGAGIGAVTVLRWLWWRVTAWAELAALLVSFVGTPLAVWAFDENAARMLALAAASTLVTVVVALAGPATDPAVLEQFARRVRPPGFWGPYDQGHARRDLARALLATAAAAVTLYAGLIATLRALFPLPDTSPLTVPLLSVLALAALPLWWRDLR